MRIIAGSAGGRRLAVPPEGTRPTTDRVREALFSALDAHVSGQGGWAGVRMLDLFAGSGAVGLEALSRGAGGATLVERDQRCLAVLRRNVDAIDPRARVIAADALSWQPEGGPYSIAYVDPPYSVDDDAVRELLNGLARSGAMQEGAWAVVERSDRSASPWPARGWEELRRRTYGDTALWYGRLELASGVEV